VITYEVRSSFASDAKAFPLLLNKSLKSVKEVMADGAYDTQSCPEAIIKKEAPVPQFDREKDLFYKLIPIWFPGTR
jgi:hypothetical protein